MSAFATIARASASKRIAQLPRSTPSITAPFSSSAVARAVVLKKSLSSVPEGTVLRGLSVLKDKPDPVALPDAQYPEWLWTLATDDAPAAQGGKKAKKETDPLKLEAKALNEEKRRLKVSNREAIKASNYLKATT
ncbi:hypothetical protein IAT38_005406 [Cryptococcus sp. DSM 104549]